MENKLEEMPHITVSSGTVDLELETKSGYSQTEFLQFIIKLFSGKEVESKQSNKKYKLDKKSAKELATKLTKNDFFRLFVNKYYDADTWDTIQKLLRNFT